MTDKTVPLTDSTVPVRQFRVKIAGTPDQGVTSADAVNIGTDETNDLVLDDRTASRFHATIRRIGSQLRLADRGSTNGTRIGGITLTSAEARLDAGSRIQIGSTTLEVSDGDLTTPELGPQRLGDLLGDSEAMRQVFAKLARAAQTEIPALLSGESGTGKELAARAIHDHGPHRDEPFVTVDCGAVARNLFLSELFGHEKGAFTGAQGQRIGAFERAGSGTVFLDEVGELSPELQTHLLGVLERKSFQRVGGHATIPMQARVLSATHRDLKKAVNSGGFRLDLFYRLAVIQIGLPPLREHLTDLGILVRAFAEEMGVENWQSIIDRESLVRFKNYDWPGNVRELRNAVQGALAMGMRPTVGDVFSPTRAEPEQVWEQPFRLAKRQVTEDFERRYLTQLLERSEGNIRQAARLGSMDRSYLMELMRRYGMR